MNDAKTDELLLQLLDRLDLRCGDFPRLWAEEAEKAIQETVGKVADLAERRGLRTKVEMMGLLRDEVVVITVPVVTPQIADYVAEIQPHFPYRNPVVLLPADVTLEKADEAEMKLRGWVRFDDPPAAIIVEAPPP